MPFDPDSERGADTADSLRSQAASCRRLAAAARTGAGRSSLDALADHFEKEARKLDSSTPWL